MIIHWNSDKAHRCPRCHTITVDSPSKWEVYTCCTCGSRFARWPRMQRFLRHVGVTCENCTKRHPVPVDGVPFGFLHRGHIGRGSDASRMFEAWLHEPDELPTHRDRLLYLNTHTTRADAIADLAHWRSFLGRQEDDLSPVLAVVVDEEFDMWASDEHREELLDGTVDVYGVGILRPHPKHGRFHADMATFTWGLIAPPGLEGIYTQAGNLPESLTAHAPTI